jgi:hypothetical protein
MHARLLVVLGIAATLSAFAESKGYDTLGPLDGDQNPMPVIERVTKFVVTHWQQHRRGYVEFTLYSKEGEPTTSRWYIEPSADGRWQIRGSSRSVYSDRRMVGDPRKQPDRHVSRSFVAVRVQAHGAHLQLTDSSGKEVDSL